MYRKLWPLSLVVSIFISGIEVLPILPPEVLAQVNTEKRRIAVLDFEFASTGSASVGAAVTGAASVQGVGPSKGISDLLVARLSNGGPYTVVERSRVEQLLKEQNLGQGGRIEAGTGAQIGRLLGVDAVIIGSITNYNLEVKQSGGSFVFFGTSSTETKATVQVNARLVGSASGEILATAEGRGDANQSDSRTQVLGIGGGTATSNESVLLSRASELAIEKLAADLSAAADKLAALPPLLPQVNARVADVTGRLVTLNKGSDDGYRVGQRVSIERVLKEVKDPETGKVLRQQTSALGVVDLQEVDKTSSVGTVLSGGNFKVGDLAKPVQSETIRAELVPPKK